VAEEPLPKSSLLFMACADGAMAPSISNRELIDRLSYPHYEALRKQITAPGEKLQLFTPFRPLSAGPDDPSGDRRLAMLMDSHPVKALVAAQDREDEPPHAPARGPASGRARAPAAPASAATLPAQHLTGEYFSVYGTMLSHLKPPTGADDWVKTLKSEAASTEKNAAATDFNNWQDILTEARKTDRTSTIALLLQKFLEVRSTCKWGSDLDNCVFPLSVRCNACSAFSCSTLDDVHPRN
jgi:hypothetical protein